MATDPLNEVRSIRRQISEDCGNDPQKVFEYYLKHQEESKRSERYRFVSTPLHSVGATKATQQAEENDSE